MLFRYPPRSRRSRCLDGADLRRLRRELGGREPEPTATFLDGCTLRSTPENGSRADSGGHKRKNGSKLHLAVDTLGHLLALTVTPADEDDRRQVGELAQQSSRSHR